MSDNKERVELEVGDVVKINYTPEDLEPEDLGMSGIVLQSPLKQLDRMKLINEDFIYCGRLEHDIEVCVLHWPTHMLMIEGRKFLVSRVWVERKEKPTNE